MPRLKWSEVSKRRPFFVIWFDIGWCCLHFIIQFHIINDIMITAMASQITSLTIFYSTMYSGTYIKNTKAENVSIWWRHHDLQQPGLAYDFPKWQWSNPENDVSHNIYRACLCSFIISLWFKWCHYPCTSNFRHWPRDIIAPVPKK